MAVQLLKRLDLRPRNCLPVIPQLGLHLLTRVQETMARGFGCHHSDGDYSSEGLSHKEWWL